MNEYTLNQIRRVADQMLEADGGGPFSVSERIAGAFVNDRADWLPDRYPNIGDALVRLGPEWREAVKVELAGDRNIAILGIHPLARTPAWQFASSTTPPGSRALSR